MSNSKQRTSSDYSRLTKNVAGQCGIIEPFVRKLQSWVLYDEDQHSRFRGGEFMHRIVA